jgi:hypothetical protein
MQRKIPRFSRQFTMQIVRDGFFLYKWEIVDFIYYPFKIFNHIIYFHKFVYFHKFILYKIRYQDYS